VRLAVRLEIRSTTSATISARQARSTITLLRCARFRDHPIEELLADLALEELPDRLRRSWNGAGPSRR